MATEPPFFCDWTPYNEKAGACWHCCKPAHCEPCCGEPCNVADGCYCFMCFWCCYPCVKSKWWASQVKQDCACVNHFAIICGLRMLAQCGSIYAIPLIMFETFFRRNARLANGVGEADDPMNLLGDCLMTCCCGACVECQELRTVPTEDWDWLKQMQGPSGFICMLDDWELFPKDPTREPGQAAAGPMIAEEERMVENEKTV